LENFHELIQVKEAIAPCRYCSSCSACIAFAAPHGRPQGAIDAPALAVARKHREDSLTEPTPRRANRRLQLSAMGAGIVSAAARSPCAW
jgi:hypothetical protein